MENTFFLRLEIWIFLTSGFYIIYYLSEKIYIIFKNIQKIIYPDISHSEKKLEKLRKKKKEEVLWKNNLKDSKENLKRKKKVKKNIINTEESQKISDILKRVKINKLKWYFDTAKAILIEWLSIDKNNKELNIELASIYEEEKDYKKAEYIYNDLLEFYNSNFEILKKLWYNLAVQRKYNESIDVFLKAHEKNVNDIEVIEFLSDLTYESKFYEKALKYINLFLKEFPRNSEKLKMKGFCYETLWDTVNAIITYKKALEIQPYNSQVIEKIDFLEQH